MNVTRRGFLAMLAGTVLVGCTRGAEHLIAPKDVARTPEGLSPEEKRLIKYFLPMLERNEDAEKEDEKPADFSFYHKSGDKVTVGYGVNVEANSSLLDDIAIYHNGVKLSAAERKAFSDDMSQKDDSALAQYTITANDAEYLSKKALLTEMRNAARILSGASGKSFLYDLPFCMQALAVDVCYNVGQGNFRGYKKFKEALLARDYDKALAQSVVYVNKKTKATNKRREWSKKRLLAIMRLVKKNASLGASKINQLLRQDYEANTSSIRKIANRHTKLQHEVLMATGEFECMQASLLKAKKLEQAKTTALKSTPVKPPVTKKASPLPKSQRGCRD